VEVTIDWLLEFMQRTTSCKQITIPGNHFVSLLDLAYRTKEYGTANLERLDGLTIHGDVILTGAEIRMLLALAFRAKLVGLPSR
jgi:hypothetical protein